MMFQSAIRVYSFHFHRLLEGTRKMVCPILREMVPGIVWPIGSMYGIYANTGGILMVNVTIYSIHGSYGWRQRCRENLDDCHWLLVLKFARFEATNLCFEWCVVEYIFSYSPDLAASEQPKSFSQIWWWPCCATTMSAANSANFCMQTYHCWLVMTLGGIVAQEPTGFLWGWNELTLMEYDPEFHGMGWGTRPGK